VTRVLLLASAAILLCASISARAMDEAACLNAWTAADANHDGALSEAEGARYFAYSRIAAEDFTELNHDSFISYCKSGMFDENAPEAGAPFDGANSFTEGQARDRIIAHGLSNASVLVKDDKGVWRGTAISEGKSVNVAVDYKGNVVVSN
jgi:hypothetical protein